MKNLICILISLFTLQVMGQTNTETNLMDKQGNKVGLWLENKGNIEAYYKDGLRDGIFKAYNRKNGKLSALGEFTKGVKSGTWYYFDESSCLILKECEIEMNTKYKRTRDDGVEITPKFTSYVWFYYPNGYIKDEGRVLYSEDIEIDYYKTGTWKHYNKDGTLKEKKEY